MDDTAAAAAAAGPASDLTLSLQPWPEPDPNETSVSRLIPLIQQQRGHFKDISESSLLAEIANPSAPTPEKPATTDPTDDSPAEDTPADEDAVAKAKQIMIESISRAQNEALLALDYISLLVSLNNPEAGNVTMSPHLKQAVPVGSLGFDKVPLKPTPAEIAQDQAVARTWKANAFKTAAGRLKEAGRKLGERVEKEGVYWEQVLRVKEDGWVVTRMPGERGVLGVKYGFVEAGSEYSGVGIGALRMGENGQMVMDDVETTGAHRNAVLRTRVMDGDAVVGVSRTGMFAGKLGGDADSVRSMIAKARNFIYDDELFFELQREARAMANQGITTSEDTVTIHLDDGRRIVLDMAPLDDTPPAPAPSNPLADTITTSLRLLLSHAHRLSLIKRSLPPPPLTAHKKPTPPLPLIRPIATHLHHHTSLTQLTALLSHLTRCLRSAGLTASYKLSPWTNLKAADFRGAQDTAEVFLKPVSTEGTLLLPGGWQVRISLRTQLGAPPLWGSVFTCSASHDGAAALLQGLVRCPGYGEVEAYVCWCVERAVVNEMRLWGDGWELETMGNEVGRNKDGRSRRVRVEMGAEGLRVVHGAVEGGDGRVVWGREGANEGRGLREVVEGI